jgi:hypothetical protein
MFKILLFIFRFKPLQKILALLHVLLFSENYNKVVPIGKVSNVDNSKILDYLLRSRSLSHVQ